MEDSRRHILNRKQLPVLSIKPMRKKFRPYAWSIEWNTIMNWFLQHYPNKHLSQNTVFYFSSFQIRKFLELFKFRYFLGFFKNKILDFSPSLIGNSSYRIVPNGTNALKKRPCSDRQLLRWRIYIKCNTICIACIGSHHHLWLAPSIDSYFPSPSLLISKDNFSLSLSLSLALRLSFVCQFFLLAISLKVKLKTLKNWVFVSILLAHNR